MLNDDAPLPITYQMHLVFGGSPFTRRSSRYGTADQTYSSVGLLGPYNFPNTETTFHRWGVPAFHYRKLLISDSFTRKHRNEQ